MPDLKPSLISFDEHYSDDSGVQFAVRYFAHRFSDSGGQGVIEFEHIETIEFPASRIDWLIECLQKIKRDAELPEPPEDADGC